jgi:hypothetical protein
LNNPNIKGDAETPKADPSIFGIVPSVGSLTQKIRIEANATGKPQEPA